jgi:hypothetical protein
MIQRPLIRVLSGFAFIFSAALTASSAASAADKLVYQVHHSKYGNIGTYTNTIEKDGNSTTVTTQGEIKVALLGVVLYRQDILRVEKWDGDRLVSFHGVTTVNGKPLEINGTAEGDHFKVATPNGSFSAPLAIRMANPWSANVLKGDMVMTPDRGVVENVRVVARDDANVALGSKTVRAKQYEIDRTDGQKRYGIWLDERGTPVKFDMVNAQGVVTFSLAL